MSHNVHTLFHTTQSFWPRKSYLRGLNSYLVVDQGWHASTCWDLLRFAQIHKISSITILVAIINQYDKFCQIYQILQRFLTSQATLDFDQWHYTYQSIQPVIQTQNLTSLGNFQIMIFRWLLTFWLIVISKLCKTLNWSIKIWKTMKSQYFTWYCTLIVLGICKDKQIKLHEFFPYFGVKILTTIYQY